MKRDYNIRQIPSKRQILVRSRQQSLKFIASQAQSRVLTEPTQLLTSSLLKLSQPALKLPSKKSYDNSAQKLSSQTKCAWCHAHRAQYVDVISSIEQTLSISKQWLSGSLTNSQMLTGAENNLSVNETVREIQQLVLQLMHDIESLTKVDIEKLIISANEFDEEMKKDTGVVDKISEAKAILNELRKEFGFGIDKRSFSVDERKESMAEVMVSNLRSRLGFVLRQYKQLKEQNKHLRSQNDKEKSREKDKPREKTKEKQKQKFKQKPIRNR